MKIRNSGPKIVAVVAATVALTALTGVAYAASSKPAQMSRAEYRALVIRSEALNEKYRLGQWKAVPAGMTAPEYRALILRSEALNKKFSLGRWSAPTAVRTSPASSHGFAWRAFGIGAVAMLGLLLVAVGVIGGSRYAPRARTS